MTTENTSAVAVMGWEAAITPLRDKIARAFWQSSRDVEEEWLRTHPGNPRGAWLDSSWDDLTELARQTYFINADIAIVVTREHDEAALGEVGVFRSRQFRGHVPYGIRDGLHGTDEICGELSEGV